jgi:anti-anti-sigma factor
MEFYYHGVDKEVLILSADGGLMAANAEQFVGELEKLVELGLRKLVVDCTRLTHISSYGVGILVSLHKTLARQGGDVKLASVPGLVARVIRLLRLESTFEIYPTVEAACSAFRSRESR